MDKIQQRSSCDQEAEWRVEIPIDSDAILDIRTVGSRYAGGEKESFRDEVQTNLRQDKVIGESV